MIAPPATVAEVLARAQAGELLGPTDIATVFHIKHSRFSVLNARGEFDHLKVRPAIGPRCFSGVKVWRYLAGEPVYEPTFGRKRSGGAR